MKTQLLVSPASWPNSLTQSVNRVLKQALDDIEEDRLTQMESDAEPRLSRSHFEMKLDLDRLGKMQSVAYERTTGEDSSEVGELDFQNLELVVAGGQLCFRSKDEAQLLFPIARLSTVQRLRRDFLFYQKKESNT